MAVIFQFRFNFFMKKTNPVKATQKKDAPCKMKRLQTKTKG